MALNPQSIPVPLDVLDAAVVRALSNIRPPWPFKRVEVTRASVKYELSDEHLGVLGELHLRAINNKETEIAYQDTLEVYADDIVASGIYTYSDEGEGEGEDEEVDIETLPDAERRERLSEMVKVSGEPELDLIRRRQILYDVALKELFAALKNDPQGGKMLAGKEEPIVAIEISLTPGEKGAQDELSKKPTQATDAMPTANATRRKEDKEKPYSPQRGRKSKYSHETMYRAVKKWGRLQKNRGKGLSGDDLDSMDEVEVDGDKVLSEFLRDTFGQNDAREPRVSERTFQQWSKNFRDGKWKIPTKKRKKTRHQ